MEDPAKLQELAHWYQEFAERTANPTIWDWRFRTRTTRRRTHRTRAPHAFRRDYRIGQNSLGVAPKGAKTMHVSIKDAQFSRRTVLEIGLGEDDLTFERCTLVGGRLNILPEVDRKIFVRCLFLGTVFTSQPLSGRIGIDCIWEPPNTEEAMPEMT